MLHVSCAAERGDEEKLNVSRYCCETRPWRPGSQEDAEREPLWAERGEKELNMRPLCLKGACGDLGPRRFFVAAM
jgi:hypothetical protein